MNAPAPTQQRAERHAGEHGLQGQQRIHGALATHESLSGE